MNEVRKGVVRTGSAPRILAVEDEPELAFLLAYNLEAEPNWRNFLASGISRHFRIRRSPFGADVRSKPTEPRGSVTAIASKAAGVMAMRIINAGT